MALADVIDEMRADLVGSTDEEIPTNPPDGIGAYPALILYPQPEGWEWKGHAGDGGRPIYGGDHVIVVEWHRSRSDLAEAIAETTTVSDAIVERLFQGFARDRFGGSVTQLRGIRCETFGELGWGADETFGVRHLVDITLYEELPADG